MIGIQHESIVEAGISSYQESIIMSERHKIVDCLMFFNHLEDLKIQRIFTKVKDDDYIFVKKSINTKQKKKISKKNWNNMKPQADKALEQQQEDLDF